MSDNRQARKGLAARVLEGCGLASRTQRRAAFENTGVAAPVSTLIDKVAKWSYKVTGEDLAEAKTAVLSEDQIFEVSRVRRSARRVGGHLAQ